MKDFKKVFLDAPDSDLDEKLKIYVKEWSDPPTSLQILKFIDMCVHTGGASAFLIKGANILLNGTLREENKTFEEVVKQATWRD